MSIQTAELRRYNEWSLSGNPSPRIREGLEKAREFSSHLFNEKCEWSHFFSAQKEQSSYHKLKADKVIAVNFGIADPFLFLTPEEIPAEFLVEEKDPLKAEKQNRKFFQWIGKEISFEEFVQMATLYRYLWRRKDFLPRVRDMLIAERVVDLKMAPGNRTHGFSLFNQMQKSTLPSLKWFIFNSAIPLCALGISAALAGICGVIWLGYWGMKITSIRRSCSETLLKDRQLIEVTKDTEAAEVLFKGMEDVKSRKCSSLTRFFHERVLGDANPLRRLDAMKAYAKENRICYLAPSPPSPAPKKNRFPLAVVLAMAILPPMALIWEDSIKSIVNYCREFFESTGGGGVHSSRKSAKVVHGLEAQLRKCKDSLIWCDDQPTDLKSKIETLREKWSAESAKRIQNALFSPYTGALAVALVAFGVFGYYKYKKMKERLAASERATQAAQGQATVHRRAAQAAQGQATVHLRAAQATQARATLFALQARQAVAAAIAEQATWKSQTVVSFEEMSKNVLSPRFCDKEEWDEFRGPITQDIFYDPVKKKSDPGHIFERSAILEVIRRGQPCPLTRNRLTEDDLEDAPAVAEEIIKRLMAQAEGEADEQEKEKCLRAARCRQGIQLIRKAVKTQSLPKE